MGNRKFAIGYGGIEWDIEAFDYNEDKAKGLK